MQDEPNKTEKNIQEEDGADGKGPDQTDDSPESYEGDIKTTDDPNPYALNGDPPFFQVEPEASYWARCRVLSTVTRQDVFNYIGVVRSYPPSGSQKEQEELAEVRERQAHAHDEDYFRRAHPDGLSRFLTDERFIRRPPEGGDLNSRRDPSATTPDEAVPGLPIIRYGAELATLFEAETPGLWHAHVFNVLLNSPSDPNDPGSPLLRVTISPPRQSLVWHALYTAIDSALDAVWHYKWLATNLPRVAYRRRPYEADPTPILYDYEITYEAGDIRRDRSLKVGKPQPSPGTPRHPAYGSGHSTYSQAASTVMACLLPEYAEDFQKLANDIGEARIWGGVHWRTDHTFGQQIGRVVGRRVIAQLNRSGVEPRPSMHVAPPDRRRLEQEAQAFGSRCGQNNNNFCIGIVDRDNIQGPRR